MAVSVNLPALGESVTEGTVTRWLKQEGDTVQADEPLLEISTDKVDTEIPAPASGVLLSIKVQEDETVEVGAELAVIGDPSEAGGSGGSGGSGDSGGEQPAQEQAPAEDARGEQEAQQAEAQQAPQEPPAQEQQPQPETQASGESAQAPQQPAQPSGGGGQVSVVLPALGESVTEGTVTRWLKQEGDSVQADEPLLEISTDKVDTEIPAPASGVLLSIKVREDETVDVGGELAIIGSGDAGAQAAEQSPGQPAEQPQQQQPAPQQPAPQAAQPEPQQEQPQQPAQPAAAQQPAPARQPPTQPAAPPPAAAAPAPSGDGGAYVTPLVRKLAAERGVDLAQVTGTGVGGRIRKQDVLDAAEAAQRQTAPSAPSAPAATSKAPSGAAAPAPSALRGRTEKLTRLRATIAKRMVESLQVSAQLTTVVEVDVTRIARLRQRAKGDFEAREGVKLSFLPFFAKAVCEALKVYPQLNASIDQEAGEVTYHEAEHLGIAVDTDRGLLVATIRDAGDLNIGGLARKIADLAERTRANKVSPDELTGGTFTLTNTGSRGALFDTPILMRPQVGILGTGAVVKRPVVVDDPDLGETIAVRSMVYLALTYDHRLVDGADAARFLTAVKARLEEGAFESDLGL
jgi:2-oxoglutarate dehydrogenase E2 component (dihydrolipoamide succinyltransferase)